MTKTSRFAVLFLVCSSAAAVACSDPASEATGSTVSNETSSACSEVYQGRVAVGAVTLSAAGAQTNAFAIPVAPSTTSHIQLTFHVESISGSPWSDFTVRLSDQQGRQLGNVVTSGGGLSVIPVLTSAYPTSNVFYAQVTLTNPTAGVSEQVTLADDVWAREGCDGANDVASGSSSGSSTPADQCSCDGVAVDGSPVHSDVCGTSVCGTDHKLWVCTTGNYQPSSDQTDCD